MPLRDYLPPPPWEGPPLPRILQRKASNIPDNPELVGAQIARELGIHYDGVWKEIDALQFTDTDGTGTTFTANSLEEARTKLAEKRLLFGPPKPKPDALTEAEAEYMNIKIPGHNFKAGETLKEAMIREGYFYPMWPAMWKPTLEKMPGRKLSPEAVLEKKVSRLEDRIADLEEQISEADDKGKDTAKLEAQLRVLHDKLTELDV